VTCVHSNCDCCLFSLGIQFVTLPKCDMAEKKRLPNFSSEEIEVLTAGFEKWAKLLFHISFTYLFTVIANDVNYTLYSL